MTQNLAKLCSAVALLGLSVGQIAFSICVFGQSLPSGTPQSPLSALNTRQGFNQRLAELAETADVNRQVPGNYLIGAQDLLQISVYGAPDLDRTVRVSRDGWISLPLIGDARAAGLSARGLELQIASLLAKRYMTHPQVSVFVSEVQSHTISVIGAVGKPGVFPTRGPENLVEVLAMAQGLADDAGDRVILMRHNGIADPASPNPPDPRSAEMAISRRESAKPGPTPDPPAIRGDDDEAQGVQISLRDLMSSDPRYDVMVYPGDVVKVPTAGIVYVVGQVRKPGGFLLKTNQSLSVLQALALAQGTTSTSAEKKARIIRTEGQNGQREEIPINLKRILAGKAADPTLQAKDILFVPNSAGKTAFYRGAEAAVSITGGLIVYRSW